MNKEKCLQYYLDSKNYSSEQIQESIEKTKKQFPNKKVKVRIALNDFGVYIITFKFENKNNYFTKIIIKLKAKIRKTLLLGNGNNKKIETKNYGQYKQTKTYKPY